MAIKDILERRIEKLQVKVVELEAELRAGHAVKAELDFYLGRLAEAGHIQYEVALEEVGRL